MYIDPTQTTLDLSNKNIGPEGAKALALELKDNHSLTTLKLWRNDIGPEGAKKLALALKENHSLTKLNLSGNDIGPEGAKALALALKENHSLTTLDLVYNSIGDEGAKALALALKENLSLITLVLGGNNIVDEGTKALALALKENLSLTTLVLWGNNIGDEGAKALALALKENHSLITLGLVNNKISVEGAKALALALKENHSLTTLVLDRNNISPEGAKALALALKDNHSLTTLDLWNNNIRDEGAKELALALKENRSLTKLNLSGNNIGPEGAKALALALKENHSLTTLELWGNNIGDEGAKALALTLKDNHSLTELDLGNNNVGPEEAKELALALKENHSLTELNLVNNKIGDEGAKALALALKDNHSLTKLDIGDNNIGPEGAKELALALKDNHSLATLGLVFNNIGDEGAKELETLLTRNKAIASIRKSIQTELSNVEKKLSQKASSEDVETLLNKTSDAIDTLKRYDIQNDVFKKEITVFENQLQDLIVQAHLQVDDIDSALSHYDNARTPQSAFLLADYLFANKLSGHEDKENRLAVLHLLRDAWTLPEAQFLTAKVAYALYHPDDTKDSVAATCQTVFGVDKVIPLSVIEESISTALSTVEKPSEEEKKDWKFIKEHLSRLSPSILYQLCQVSPLAEVLQRNIGTHRVTSFFHLPTQDEYPLSSPEKKVSLSELVTNLKREIHATAAEERTRKEGESLETKDSLERAFGNLMKAAQLTASTEDTPAGASSASTRRETAGEQEEDYSEDTKQPSNQSYHTALTRMKQAYLARNLRDMTLPPSVNSLYTLLHEKLTNVKEGYDKTMSYANDYQVCVKTAIFFFEQINENTHQKQFSLFSESTKTRNYGALANFMRDIKAGTFLDEIAPQETPALPPGPSSTF